MRKKTVRVALLLAVMFIGSLTAASNTVRQTAAMPRSLFLQEYQRYYPDVLNEITMANATLRSISVPFNTANRIGWNNSMLGLISILQDIDRELKVLPYTAFTMDKLLLKFDFALSYAIGSSEFSSQIQNDVSSWISSFCGNPPSNACLVSVGFAAELSSRTHTINEKVVAIGFLFTKAKLEFLEFPRLNCFPLQVVTAGKLYCTGQSVNGTATLQINNTQTGQLTMIGSSKADSFFDVFFEIALPTSIGTGHWQAVMTDSGGAQASSFFDVFVALPTAFEPNTIIPLTVLIAAVATLAVASRKVRRLQ